jgi:hypothetical protein
LGCKSAPLLNRIIPGQSSYFCWNLTHPRLKSLRSRVKLLDRDCYFYCRFFRFIDFFSRLHLLAFNLLGSGLLCFFMYDTSVLITCVIGFKSYLLYIFKPGLGINPNQVMSQVGWLGLTRIRWVDSGQTLFYFINI